MTARPEYLPSGRYRATTWDANGQRKGPSRTFDRESEAYAWAQATERAMDRTILAHGIEVKRNGKPVTFAEYAGSWTRSGPPSTQRAAESNARALAACWPAAAIADITPTMVRAMLHSMEEGGRSVSTRTGRLTLLRKIMADAVAEGLRSDDPTVGIKGPKQVKDAGRHRFITDELDRVLAALPSWLHPAVFLSRDSGLRIAEVCGLLWHRLNLPHGRVTVSDVVLADGTVRGTPKGGGIYTVALTARTVAALRLHRERYCGDPRECVFREPGIAPLCVPPRLPHSQQRPQSRGGRVPCPALREVHNFQTIVRRPEVKRLAGERGQRTSPE